MGGCLGGFGGVVEGGIEGLDGFVGGIFFHIVRL